MSGIATAVEASMGLSCGNKTPFLTNPSHIYPRCNKGALRVLWVLGSSIEFTCSVYRSLLNIQTFPFLQYSVIWITSGRSLGIKDLGNQHYIHWWCFARTCLSGPSLSFSQIVLAQVSKLFQWLELAMPFWLYIHDLFCSDVHLFLAVHLSCPEEHHVLWAISIKPIDQALLVALPTLQPFSWLFSASTWLLAPLLRSNTGKPSPVTASPPISFCLQRIAITQVVDDAGPHPLHSAFLIALGNYVSPRSFWRSQSADGCSGLNQQTYPSMPFLWALWPFPSELSQQFWWLSYM